MIGTHFYRYLEIFDYYDIHFPDGSKKLDVLTETFKFLTQTQIKDSKGRYMKKIIFISFILLFSMDCNVHAAGSTIQISLFTPIQIVPAEQGVTALRINFIYGMNTYIKGIDIGLFNQTISGQSVGVQLGLAGLNNQDFLGGQVNSVNITSGNFEGLQWGLVNYAGAANGLQLGFFNYAGTLKGLQIGLINIINIDGAFPFLPIVNWSF